MNFIEKIKIRKEEKKPINIVLNSEFDYKDHDLNILKACLNTWVKNSYSYSPIKFEWMYTDPEQKEKMFFISTNMKELRKMKMENIINNKIISSLSYMNTYFDTVLFSQYDVNKIAA